MQDRILLEIKTSRKAEQTPEAMEEILASLTNVKTNFFSKKLSKFKFFKKHNKYREFVFDQADYQKRLKEIEHLIME